MNADVAKMVGDRLDVSVGRLEVQVERLEGDVSEMKGDIKAIRTTLDNASGSWKMLVIVAGFAAAVGGFVTKVVSLWPFAK
jgi:tetrahydromethanopterin S-methyltransferase subunit B